MFENLYRRDGDSEDVDECEKSKSRTRTGRLPESLHSVNQLFLRTYARVMPLLCLPNSHFVATRFSGEMFD